MDDNPLRAGDMEKHFKRVPQWASFLASPIQDPIGLAFLKGFPFFEHCMDRLAEIRSVYPNAPELPDAEAIALLNYTSCGASRVNPEIEDNGFVDVGTRDMARLVFQAISRLPTFRGVVWRIQTIQNDRLWQFKVGENFCIHAFGSASMENMGDPENGRIRFRINSITGSRLAPYSLVPGEKEILFKPETMFHVDKMQKDGTRLKIDLTEVFHAQGTGS